MTMMQIVSNIFSKVSYFVFRVLIGCGEVFAYLYQNLNNKIKNSSVSCIENIKWIGVVIKFKQIYLYRYEKCVK